MLYMNIYIYIYVYVCIYIYVLTYSIIIYTYIPGMSSVVDRGAGGFSRGSSHIEVSINADTPSHHPCLAS